MRQSVNRRTVVGGLAATAALAPRFSFAKSMPLPESPVAINIMDVGGALALLQDGFEEYARRKPEVVSRFTFAKAPAPELAGKLSAQQSAGRLNIDLVLTGSDGLASGRAKDVWLKLLPDYSDHFPGLMENYEPAALNLQQKQGQGYGIVCTYYPSGPLLEYLPGRVSSPPKTAEELLEWAKSNNNKFMYARPTNSGPGRTFIMGLPYILGDKDPSDPVNGWEKTWSYLEKLGEHIEYYPAGTSITMRELGQGVRDMIVTTTGWDINPRFLGIVPKEAKIATIEGFHWVSDAFFMTVPKGISDEKLGAILDVMNFILTPEIQAYAYDEGYLYPGPAVKDVTIDMAPKKSQEVIEKFGRPEYKSLIADNPIELPLKPELLVKAFRLWDERVGARKS